MSMASRKFEKSNMAKKVTNRGFAIFADFEDKEETNIYVVKSSIATKHKVRIYLTAKNENDPYPKGACHLTIVETKKLIRALKDFVDTYNELDH